MKKLLLLSLTFLTLCVFVSCEKNDDIDTDTTAAKLKKFYGDYKIESIHWSGLSVDLNNDGTGRWDLLDEMQGQIGYYEPAYILTIGNGTQYGDVNGTTAAFVLPYPSFNVQNDIWEFAGIKELKLCMPIDDMRSYYFPKRLNGDAFLSKMERVVIEVLSDGKVFVFVNCTIPNSEEEQKLSNSMITYTLVKK